MLTLDRLSLRFDHQPVLDRVSLTLDQGRIGCLIGPSGCGKTSLLRPIAGFLAPASGQVMLGDETVAEAIEVDQRSLLGIQKQEQKAEKTLEVCTIRTRRGAEVVELPIPCRN